MTVRTARVLLCWLLGMLVWLPASAWAARLLELGSGDQSYTLEGALEYLVDAGGDMSIKDVAQGGRAAQFRPYAGSHPNFGNSDAAFWFRFSARATTPVPVHWFIDIDFPPLDLVDLYTDDGAGGFHRQQSGDTIPFGDRSLHVPSHMFNLDATSSARTYYLRVTSSGSVTVPIAIYGEEALREYRSGSQLGAGVFFGCLIGLGLYNLLLYFSVRDRSYFYYTIATALFILVYLSTFGYGFQYLWPNAPYWNNRSPATLALLALAATVPFTRAFLHTRFNVPWLDRAMLISCGSCVVVALLNLGVIAYASTFKFFSGILAVHVVLLLWTSFACMRRGDPLAKFFLLAWMPMILAAVAYVLRALTILPAHFLTIYGFQIGSALEMILLSFALAYRITQSRREKEMAQEALLATLKESERVLEERVAQRTSELNSANLALEEEVAERRRAEERLTLMAHHDALTGLPNRALLKERFSQAVLQGRRPGRLVGVLLLDLDGFKLINDTFGHDVGDEVLVAVGRLLSCTVRESDTVARLGGDEFVVLMTDMPREMAAGDVAEKILVALGQPLAISEGRALQVGASLGIAIHPQDGPDLDLLLRRADSAMYQAKGAGRLCFRYFSAPAGGRSVLLSGMQTPEGAPRTSGQ